MGAVRKEYVERQAMRLLLVLEDRDFVDFSYFYNERTANEEFKDAPHVSVAFAMDVAVSQLKRMGVVTRTKLPTLLVDDNHDYRIAWTENGRELAKGYLAFKDGES